MDRRGLIIGATLAELVVNTGWESTQEGKRLHETESVKQPPVVSIATVAPRIKYTGLLLPGVDGAIDNGFLPQLRADAKLSGINLVAEDMLDLSVLKKITSPLDRQKIIEQYLERLDFLIKGLDEGIDILAWSAGVAMFRKYIKRNHQELKRRPLRNVVSAFSGLKGNYPDVYTDNAIAEVAEITTGKVVLAASRNDSDPFKLETNLEISRMIPGSEVLDMGQVGHGNLVEDAPSISQKLLPFLKR